MRFSHLVLTVTCGLAVLSLPVIAAAVTWDGDTDTNWSEAGNWDTGVPGNVDIAVFPAAFTPNQPTLNVNDQARGVKFTKTDGGWTLGGAGKLLTLGPSFDTTGLNAIEDLATSGTTTIECDINPTGFGPYRIVLNGGDLHSHGYISPNGNQEIVITGPGKASFAKLGGPGGPSTGRFILQGDGTLELRGPAGPAVAGTIRHLNSVTLILGDKTAWGSGLLEAGSSYSSPTLQASIDLTGTNAIPNAIDIVGHNVGAGGKYTFSGAHSMTFTGALNNLGGRDVLWVNDVAAGEKVLFTSNLAMDGRIYFINGDGTTEFSGDLSGTYGDTSRARMNRGSAGDGVLILSGTNTYTGITNVGSGVLKLASPASLAPSKITTGGEGVIGLTFDFTRPLSWAGSTPGTVRLSGGGFAAYGADRNVNFGGAGATHGWGGATGFMSTGAIFVLSHETADATINMLNPINLSLGGDPGPTRTFKVNDGSADIDARLQGAVSGSATMELEKTGAGTLDLAGDNTYLGATLVREGALLVTGDSSAATGAITVDPGATLGGSGIVGGATMINGALAPGTSAGVLRFENDVTLDALAALDIELGGTTSGVDYDVLDVGGMLTLGGSTLNVELLAPFSPGDGDVFDILDWGDLTGSFTAVNLPPLGNSGLVWDDTDLLTTGELSVAGVVVPEPGTLALLGLVALRILGTRRRR